ncbi:DNA polymerase III subunit epsilon [Rodentibacter pneumotropicus]|uniref:DNA polymerase III subunit epsilon n=3 Tax=Rodentibacter pneumotropicus TaxID=758 RepID=A0A1V3K4Z4_9PAST|nr:DNA polymerase III subunit epsilon [Rodentibacter pneumotropicus]MCQ9122021.1 DNA polymerase III subunit epsilon [Rodentibacter pneumotropicus]MDC2825377.1 DNA polymerase III subunit epsilon [Rodentibacter pneumotropicus]NBH75280.1 DNA polymerase III subunit epsilon [Rodentibacter pneumotropicus]OOF63258.1 DNA polymerase III subunit epsilon [Rodentibacter pneumotropicus]OOF63444.1 DNA polymerase III subunit epsilon [Rodentibacter pneumotropicus]
MINPNRQIVLDTETTGMNQLGAHYEGHGIIEIGAVELVNRRYTGNNFHIYINPNRPVDPEAIKVHGITDEMLADKPEFKTVAQEFLDYIKGAELLIHNAPFDVGFMDYEFSKLGLAVKTTDICVVTDTLQMARQMYPGKRNSLDALCDRLGIDNSKRTLHGALLDAEILADVYLSMTGGQTSLFDEGEEEINIMATIEGNAAESMESAVTFSNNLKRLQPSEEELQAHLELLKVINKKSNGNCLWDLHTNDESVH